MDPDEVHVIVKEVLRQLEKDPGPLSGMADKWDGGSLIIKPGDSSMQSKEMSVESLFHKVIMVRDKLRVLEQKINSHAKLTDAEKVEMQQYITRCYGSLTSFNVLFKREEDKFHGSGSGE
jgi:hypothetical protein